MSRIGRMPIAVPAGVTVEIAENNHVTVKGPKGTLERTLPSEMDIKLEGEEVVVTRPNDLKKMKSLHGLTRTLINNMVVGVTTGYEKTLEVNGVGYRASKAGKKLTLNLGYSHPVEMEDPEGIERVSSQQLTEIKLSSRVSTRKRLVSTLPTSEIREDLSHIRVRVLSTLMKLLDVKSVRPVRNSKGVNVKW